LTGIVLVGVFAFLVGQRLSADAVGMAIGVLFGVLAGIPVALLVIASGRRRQEAEFEGEDEYDVEGYGERRGRRNAAYNALPAQSPVIIFAPPSVQYTPGYNGMVQPAEQEHINGRRSAAQRALPGPTSLPGDGGRAFKVIGEREEWITEW
jgi:hypothetical protein